jgi:hypothetical protein
MSRDPYWLSPAPCDRRKPCALRRTKGATLIQSPVGLTPVHVILPSLEYLMAQFTPEGPERRGLESRF